MSDLPTFEEMRRNAHKLLGDALQELDSDWRDGAGPSRIQVEATHDARTYIDMARDALDRAAR